MDLIDVPLAGIPGFQRQNSQAKPAATRGRETRRRTSDQKPNPSRAVTIPSAVLMTPARTWAIADCLNFMYRLRSARWHVPRPLKMIERAIHAEMLVSCFSPKNQAIAGERMTKNTVSPAMIRTLTQKSFFISSSVSSSLWMIASVNPLTPKFWTRMLNVATMDTSPKSSGLRIRAMMMVPTVWIP